MENKENIYEIIKRSKYPDTLYENYIQNPIIGKESCWNPLGDKLSLNEKTCPSIISPEKYFTIRADGKNFSSVLPKLKKLGILEKGYSIRFENIMKTIAHKISLHLQRVLFVFTQSDEITILIENIKNESNSLNQNEIVHEFGGRKDKLISLTSSFISSVFTQEIFKICLEQNNNTIPQELLLQMPVIIFDARIGVYDSLQDAFELILWRSYDCSVNGISQFVYNNYDLFTGISKKEMEKKNTSEKLKIINDHKLLPLRDHQAYGYLIEKKYEDLEKINQKTGEKIKVNKKVFREITGPIIKKIKDNYLLNL